MNALQKIAIRAKIAHLQASKKGKSFAERLEIAAKVDELRRRLG